MIRRITALAGGVILAATMALAGATWASATTLTCTHTAGATTVPIGCGGIQSALASHGTLDLAVLGTGTATGNYFNSPVGVRLDSQSSVREDFTVFAVGGAITGGPGNLGKYVAMYTPDGKIPGFTVQPAANTSFTANSSDLCLSVVQKNNGPRGALRWNTVLRNCNTNGTFHIGGNTTPADENSVTSGHANAYQVWAPVTGANGLLFVNQSLSRNFHSGNTQYVLDIKGSGGDGSALLAFPENDQLNEEWSVVGCTHPADVLSTGYAFCP
jgi:hypothetical protein